jgi:hypothetical protein
MCDAGIQRGSRLRYLATVVLAAAFYPSIRRYPVLAAVILFALDFADVAYLELVKSPDKVFAYRTCTRTFAYQGRDKVCDLLSYVLFFLVFFRHDAVLAALVLFRLVGVLLFLWTEDEGWLVPFFDFFKEYVVYTALFRDRAYLAPLMVLKVVVEYFMHAGDFRL